MDHSEERIRKKVFLKSLSFCAYLALLFLLLFIGDSFQARAAQSGETEKRKTVDVDLTFNLNVVGEGAPVSDYRIYIERAVESPNEPLPNPFFLDIRKGEGKDEFHFPRMRFVREGVYRYKVKQEQKNNSGFTYDPVEYDLVVEVLKASIDRFGNSVPPYLYAVVLAKKPGEEKSALVLQFNNYYDKAAARGADKTSFLPVERKGTAPSVLAVHEVNYPAGWLGHAERFIVAMVQPFRALSGKMELWFRVWRRALRGEGSKVFLYSLASLFATGSISSWIYQLRFHEREDDKKRKESRVRRI